ncbi:MAG: glycosyltransferase [Pseudomonadota bacterium]
MIDTTETTVPSVFFLVPSGAGSGEERQAFLHLSMARHAGSVVRAATDAETWLARQCRSAGVDLVPLSNGFGGDRALQHAIKTSSVDVLHGFGAAGASLAVKLARSADRVSIVSLFSPDNAKAAKKADHVLASDSGCARELERLGVDSDQLVVHGFAAPDQRRLGSHTRASARTALRLSDEQIAVYVPGPLRPDLGQDVLIAALEALGDERIRVFMTGARDTEFAREIHLQAAQLTATAGGMLGQIADPSLLQGFDLCAAPIRAPHACHHVLAAINAGLPLLTNPIGAMNDLVEDGESGMFALRDNTAGWVRILERALADTDDFERMGINAIAQFRAQCSMRRCARRYTAILKGLVALEAPA